MNKFSVNTLKLDVVKETERICTEIKRIIPRVLKRQGVVVAMSGGIDSSTVAALCVKALGPDKVIGLFMPERDSSEIGRASCRERVYCEV